MSVFPFTVKVVPRPGTSSERPAEPGAADGPESAVASAAPAALEAWGQVEGGRGQGGCTLATMGSFRQTNSTLARCEAYTN